MDDLSDKNFPDQNSDSLAQLVSALNNLRDDLVELSLNLHDYVFELEASKSELLRDLSSTVITRVKSTSSRS